MSLYVFIVGMLLVVLFVSQSARTRSTVVQNGDQCYYGDTRFAKVTFILLMTFFCILTGWRAAEIGNDTSNYIEYFKIYSSYVSLPESIEFGYQCYCYLIGHFTDDPHVFLIVTALICYTAVGIAIYRYSKHPAFSLCLFFCIFFSAFTNTLRQSLALSICVFAYFAIKKKHFIRAVALIVLAIMFHKSALVMFALFLYRFIPTKPKIVFPVLLAVVALSMSGMLAKTIVFLLPQYRYYVESDYLSHGWIAVSYYLLRNAAFYILAYVSYKKCTVPGKQLILSVFVILLWMTGLGFAVNLFTRASEYLLIVAVIELPNAFCDGKLKNKNLYLYLLCLAMLAYFIVTLIVRPEWNNLYPYRFWQEM